MSELVTFPPPVRRLLGVASGLVGGSGLAYGVLRYLWPPGDPDAVVNHPWQPHLQHFHVLLAPLLAFALGAVWVAHVWPARRQPERAVSGVLAWWLAVVMVLSGVLVQVVAHPTWRALAGWGHTGAGVAWLLTLLLHRRRRERTPP
ncbi:MAG: hypothetical protein HRF46_04885 [Acidobacteriota bacterium]|jgi:heme A synthase